jgi:hypothetical protein
MYLCMYVGSQKRNMYNIWLKPRSAPDHCVQDCNGSFQFLLEVCKVHPEPQDRFAWTIRVLSYHTYFKYIKKYNEQKQHTQHNFLRVDFTYNKFILNARIVCT